jgi:hypothetical protein
MPVVPGPSDLLALIFALQKGQEYCYTTPLVGSPEESGARRHPR